MALLDKEEYGESGEDKPKQHGLRYSDSSRQLVNSGLSNLKLVAAAGLGALCALAVTVLLLVWKINTGSHVGRYDCRLRSDAYFGDIPWTTVILEHDDRFQKTDPGLGQNGSLIWHEIKPTTMVAVSNPARYGLHGGGKMWENPNEFDDTAEAYTVSVMHHLHCLGNIKQYFHNARRGEVMTDDELAHLSHCTEVLRQAIMCHADLALERPTDTSVWPQRVSGWGNDHRCRDWDAVIAAVKKHAITRGTNGWRRMTEEDFRGPITL